VAYKLTQSGRYAHEIPQHPVTQFDIPLSLLRHIFQGPRAVRPDARARPTTLGAAILRTRLFVFPTAGVYERERAIKLV